MSEQWLSLTERRNETGLQFVFITNREKRRSKGQSRKEATGQGSTRTCCESGKKGLDQKQWMGLMGRKAGQFLGSIKEDNLMTPKQKQTLWRGRGPLPHHLTNLYTPKSTFSFSLHQVDTILRRIKTYFLYAPRKPENKCIRLVGPMISVTTHTCLCRVKTGINNMDMNGYGWVPISLYL